MGGRGRRASETGARSQGGSGIDAYKRFSSVSDAQDALTKAGVKNDLSGLSPTKASAVASSVLDAKKDGVNITKVTTGDLGDNYAVINEGTGVLKINNAMPNMKKSLEEDARSGWNVTPTVHAMVQHEAGHRQMVQMKSEKRLNQREFTKQYNSFGKISIYGQKDAYEGFAEGYSWVKQHPAVLRGVKGKTISQVKETYGDKAHTGHLVAWYLTNN